MQAKDTLLILPLPRWESYRYSLGVLYISAYLRENGYDNIIVERNFLDKPYSFENAKDSLISKIKELKPKVIAFTAMSPEAYKVVQVNKEIKKIHPKVISIIGGPHATVRPEDFLDTFDIAVVGEGEETFLELIKAINKNKSYKKIDGIAYKEKKKIIKTKPRVLIKDISSLPLPAYDKIPMQIYTKLDDKIIRGFPIKTAKVFTSRGCPYSCTYCHGPRVFGRAIRYRNRESIEKEIDYLIKNHKIEAIYFLDDTLTISREHIDVICDIMKKRKLLWGCQARVDNLNDIIIKKMAKCGCIQIEFGVETGSQRILDDIIKKGTTVQQTINIFKACKKYNIRRLADLMVGFPDETREEMEATYKLAKKIKANFNVYSILMPLPGTELYDMFGENISVEEYDKLDFLGADLTNRYNKTKVKDLYHVAANYRSKLTKLSLYRSILEIDFYIKTIIKLNNKTKRISFLIKKAIDLFTRLLKGELDYK